MRSCIIVALFAAQLLYAGIQHSFYVAPNGSDSNPGSEGQPFATLQRAADKIDEVNNSMTGDIVVYVKAGDYYVDQTVELTDDHSGSGGNKVIIKNADAVGSAHFTGGREITGWQQHEGNIYKAACDLDFFVLFENGTRAIRAREPNLEFDPNYPTSRYKYLRGGAPNGDVYTTLTYYTGDLDPSGWDLSDEPQIRMWYGPNNWRWQEGIHTVTGINASTRVISFTPRVNEDWQKTGGDDQADRERYGTYYYLDGSLSFLDMAGEFHLDKDNNVLYYHAYDSQNPSNHTIVAPTVHTILKITGSNIVMEGLSFSVTDRGANPFGNVTENGIVTLKDTRNVRIVKCHVSSGGLEGIVLRNVHNSSVRDSWVHGMGGGGILVWQGNDDTVYNCKVHDIGAEVGGVSLIGQNKATDYSLTDTSFRLVVMNCELFNSPRWAVRWGSNKAHHQSGDHLFKYLRVYNCGQASNDMGAIYCWQAGPGTVMEQIHITDMDFDLRYPGGHFQVSGLYFDDNSTGQICRNIKVEGIQDCDHCSLCRLRSTGHTVFNVNWRNSWAEGWSGGAEQMGADFDESLMEYDKIGLTCDFPGEYGGSGKSECGATVAQTALSAAAKMPAVRLVKGIMIDKQSPVYFKNVPAHIEIYNARGQMVESIMVHEIDQLDLSGTAKGIHLFRIKEGGKPE
ncbi:MAG: hypothetical protein GF401_15410 [Chitinivibrionales bacterium]|nr:hypothetical protein [Chitinivibrionales bacterium]